jgi:hypothetical protein
MWVCECGGGVSRYTEGASSFFARGGIQKSLLQMCTVILIDNKRVKKRRKKMVLKEWGMEFDIS